MEYETTFGVPGKHTLEEGILEIKSPAGTITLLAETGELLLPCICKVEIHVLDKPLDSAVHDWKSEGLSFQAKSARIPKGRYAATATLPEDCGSIRITRDIRNPKWYK